MSEGTSTKQRRIQNLLHECRPFLPRSVAGGISKSASFWFLSLLVCFFCWNGLAQGQDPLAQLKQQCDQLERNSKWSEAIAVAEKILALTEEKHGEEHAETVDAMHTLARLVNCNDDHPRDEQLWQRTLAIEEKLFGMDSPEAARSLRTLGNLSSYRGEYEKAEELLQRARQNLEAAPPAYDLELGKVLCSLGQLYCFSLGDFNRAESALMRAIETLERSRGADGEEYLARSLDTLGQLHLKLGDFAKAEPLLVRSLRFREKNLGTKHAATAFAMGNLALLYSMCGNVGQAEQLFQGCLAIEEEVFDSSEQEKMFYTLLQFGGMYLNSGELAKAEPLLARALSVSEGNPWLAGEREPFALNALGSLYECKGDDDKAEGYYARACRICERRFGPLRENSTFMLRHLARIRFARGRSDDAMNFADQIQDAEEKNLANILSFTSERQRLNFARGRLSEEYYNLWATIGAARPLARAMLRTKGIVLDSLLEDRLVAEASGDSEVRLLSSKLSKAKQRLGQLSPVLFEEVPVSRSRPLKTNDLEAASKQVESLEGALARCGTALGGARRALATQIEAVQAAVPKDTALLEMLRYNHYQGKGQSQPNYGALILLESSEPLWVPLGPAAAIDKNIRLYQHLVRAPGEQEALASRLRKLCDQVWQPIQSALPEEISRIIISPDSELNFLSFAALLTPDGRFLAEKFDIGYVSTARDLLVHPPPVAGTPSLVIWANPDFGASVSRRVSATGELAANRAASARELRDLRLQPLPGSEKEGKQLSEIASSLGFREVVLHLGPGATEAQLRRVQSPRVLHLATHGFVLPELSSETSAPAIDAESIFPRRSEAANNPMLRSGLALAGAQRTIEAWARGEAVPADNDGIVTAEEIGTLDLKNTWLVVLSACDTGLGVARSGEGVLGLRRGFIQAGAKNLLMTLWPIDDERAADLIADFYAADKEYGNAAEALSVTQRNWLARLRPEKGVAEACRVAGPFILSFQGNASSR